MRTKYLLVFSFILYLPFAVISQPGYLGKRFQGGYGLSFSPALVGSNGAGKSFNGRDGSHAETGEPAFNSLHEGFIEYCIKNRTMLGFSAKFYKTTYDNHMEVEYDNYYSPSGSISVLGTPEGLYTIKGINYTLYFKFYHRHYTAPWGRYFLLGPTINKFVCSYDPNQMYLRYDPQTPIDIAKKKQLLRPAGPGLHAV